jgi:hypothetical protein
MRRWITAHEDEYFACPKCGMLYKWERDEDGAVVFVHWHQDIPCEHFTGEFDETADPNTIEIAFFTDEE